MICAETLDNEVMAKDIMKVRKDVTEGKTMSEPLSKVSYFPEMVTQMIKVGEATGDVDNMLEKVSSIFEDEVEESIAGATKMLEPIILVFLGGMVGVILIAMYLPIFMSAGGVE